MTTIVTSTLANGYQPGGTAPTLAQFGPHLPRLLRRERLHRNRPDRRLLRHGEFDSVDDLAERIIAFINDYNRTHPAGSGPAPARTTPAPARPTASPGRPTRP